MPEAFSLIGPSERIVLTIFFLVATVMSLSQWQATSGWSPESNKGVAAEGGGV